MRGPIIIALLVLAVVVSTGLFVSDFTAYLGDDPTTCNNCHVMDSAYEGWFHAPHREWAGCNDCHTPHALIPKYITKAQSGYHHVTAFTFGNIPDAIRATEHSLDIVQQNCIRCHADSVDAIAAAQDDAAIYCFECHRDIAHGERGVSILPYKDEAEH